MGRALIIAVFVCCLYSGGPAWAGLGEGVGQLRSDSETLKASGQSTLDKGLYTVHSLDTDSGTIREFSTKAGTVFAVAWEGMAHQDVAAVLGKYWNEYRALRSKKVRRHGARYSVQRGTNIVVEHWGHQRHLQGRVYVPSLLPAGVKIDEIR